MSFQNNYRGRYSTFDATKISHYPLSERTSKVEIDDFVDPAAVIGTHVSTEGLPWYKNGIIGRGYDQTSGLTEIAKAVVRAVKEGQPVVAICGAHFIKSGLSPLIVDLINRGMITLFSGNMASAIHSFEFSLTGSSSESVSAGLPTGSFGMAIETNAYINSAIRQGASDGISVGEALGLMYCDDAYRKLIIESARACHPNTDQWIMPYEGFPHIESCVYAAAYESRVPACVHPTIGTDIINQYQFFDAAALGAAAGHDFLIFVEQMARFTDGGVILNIGSAVTGPEVVLKACAMAANVGCAPKRLITADFDLRPFGFGSAEDETSSGYYFRDQKSIVSRIPAAFGGSGYYFQGPHSATLPALYTSIIETWNEHE